ncbi:MAG TPA: hypothetical protein VF546_01935 [Pyrinomonadaceae bacterium]|jgi:hypothetical protein
MKDLQRILTSALMLGVLATGALADQRDQKRDPPPKEPVVIEKRDKEPKREQPRNDNNRPKEGNDNRRRPD